jgi:hypothetical protein
MSWPKLIQRPEVMTSTVPPKSIWFLKSKSNQSDMVRQFGATAALCRSHGGVYLGASAIVLYMRGFTILPLSKFLHVVEHLPFHKILGSQGYMHVASDCFLDVSNIRKESMGSTGSIVSKIRSRAAFLNDCSFVHKRRASNFESRNLHRHALSCDVGRHVWLFALAPYYVNIISE